MNYVTTGCAVKDETILDAKKKKWMECDPALKENIRLGVRFFDFSIFEGCL